MSYATYIGMNTSILVAMYQYCKSTPEYIIYNFNDQHNTTSGLKIKGTI